jgi:hypothetical protein
MVDVVSQEPRHGLPHLPRRWIVTSAGVVGALAVIGAGLMLWHGREVISCSHPTATVATDHTLPIGSPDLPTVGPIGLHPDPYQAGSATRTHVEARAAHPDPITLTGYNCGDRTPLHFWYDPQGDGSLPVPEVRLDGQGTAATTLPAGPNVQTFHGYLLFTTTGDWLIVARTHHRLLGTVLVHVRATIG